MEIEVAPALRDAKPVVRRLLELNAHDFSETDGREIGPHGEYGYPYLDHYWTEPDTRRPYLVTVDGRIAGCVLVRLGDPHELGELFVLRKHRRRGVGTVAARTVFGRHPGAWAVHQIPGHDAATVFWRRAIPVAFAERRDGSGTTRTFVVPGPVPPQE